MKLLDLERSVAGRFRELPYAAYLCCMYVVAGELRAAYQGLFSEKCMSLSAETVEAAIYALNPTEPAVRDLGSRLQREWRHVFEDEDGPEGWFAVTYTFESLAGELSGKLKHYAATEYVTDAAVKIPVGRGEAAAQVTPQLVRSDFDQEADEASAGVQMLRKLGQIAQMIAEQTTGDLVRELDKMRSEVFG